MLDISTGLGELRRVECVVVTGGSEEWCHVHPEVLVPSQRAFPPYTILASPVAGLTLMDARSIFRAGAPAGLLLFTQSHPESRPDRTLAYQPHQLPALGFLGTCHGAPAPLLRPRTQPCTRSTSTMARSPLSLSFQVPLSLPLFLLREPSHSVIAQ